MTLLFAVRQDGDDLVAAEAAGILTDIVSDEAPSARFPPVDNEVMYIVTTVTTDIRRVATRSGAALEGSFLNLAVRLFLGLGVD